MATVFYRGFYREIEDLRLQYAWLGEVTGKNSKKNSIMSIIKETNFKILRIADHLLQRMVALWWKGLDALPHMPDQLFNGLKFVGGEHASFLCSLLLWWAQKPVKQSTLVDSWFLIIQWGMG